MNAFVINLDSRPDRMESFGKNKFPFKVERFSAIKSPVEGHGEYGCALSHLTLLNQQTKFPFVIFEDDCLMLQDWKVVQLAMKQLPNNWDGLWLGVNVHENLERYSKNLFRIRKAWCLHAVIYNSARMVDFVLSRYRSKLYKDIDKLYHDVVMPRFNCFVVYPIVATQISDKSDISLIQTNNAEEIVQNYNRHTQ